MKTVLLLRHGKSDWNSDTGNDLDRQLAKRGERAARVVGRMLARHGLVPDLAVTSPAVRAVTTLELARKAGGWDCPVKVSPSLYQHGPQGVFDEIISQPDDAGRVLLVGHEPTWSETLSLLVGGGEHRFPTGAVAAVDLDVARWSLVRPGCGRLMFLVVPRLLEE